MAKKEFAWDSEEEIGEIMETEKTKHVIKRCTRNGKEFIVATKMYTKTGYTGWLISKNQTFEAGVFDKMVELVHGK